MFPDSSVAIIFLWAKLNAHTLHFGIARYFKNELLQAANNSPFQSILFDESLNSNVQQCQMDVLVRFWDSTSGKAIYVSVSEKSECCKSFVAPHWSSGSLSPGKDDNSLYGWSMCKLVCVWTIKWRLFKWGKTSSIWNRYLDLFHAHCLNIKMIL